MDTKALFYSGKKKKNAKRKRAREGKRTRDNHKDVFPDMLL